MFLSIAQGSASEVETELIIGYRLKYSREGGYEYLIRKLDDSGRMITGLCQHLVKTLDK